MRLRRVIDMKYAIYLGCITPLRYPDIEASVRETLPELGVELEDIPKATCCPPGGAFWSADEMAAMAISARNISLAEEMNLDMMTICNGCYGFLKKTNEKLKHDEEKRKKINEMLKRANREFKGTIKVKHIAEVLYEDVGVEKIKEAVKRPLTGLKFAVHPGCHLMRPSDYMNFDDPESPHKVEVLVEALGAEVVEWRDKTKCCGAGGGMRGTDPELALKITKEKLLALKEAQVDAVVTVCPFCHLQFDIGQDDLRKRGEIDFSIPSVYYTHLLAIAMGRDPKQVLSFAKTPRNELIKKLEGV